jgi:hypothetical protein
MKPSYLMAGIFICLLSIGNTFAADEISVYPVVGVGNSSLEFVRESPGNTDVSEGGTFYVFNVAGVVTYRDFFLNLATDIPLTDISFYETPARSANEGLTNIHREDYSLTLGYTPIDWMTVFAGYAIGLTDITTRTVNSYTFLSQYDDRGFFAGLNFSTILAGKGSLSFDLAYANFDGALRTRNNDPAIMPEIALNRDRRVTGPTTGFSYGLQWTAKLRNDMSYYIKLKKRDYSFEAEDSDSGPPPGGLTVDQDFTMLSLGLIF